MLLKYYDQKHTKMYEKHQNIFMYSEKFFFDNLPTKNFSLNLNELNKNTLQLHCMVYVTM